MAFVGAKQQKRYQENFLDGAMEGFREDFDTHVSVEGLTLEQIEALEKGLQVAESMFEDIVGAVNNFCTSKRAVRNQDG